MTPEEIALLELTAKVWNLFLELPDRHPCDDEETARDLHNIQNRICARVAKRANPEILR